MVCPKYNVDVVNNIELVAPDAVDPVKLAVTKEFINVDETVCDMLIVHDVPDPPVITVSCATPTPNNTWPMAIVPL